MDTFSCIIFSLQHRKTATTSALVKENLKLCELLCICLLKVSTAALLLLTLWRHWHEMAIAGCLLTYAHIIKLPCKRRLFFLWYFSLLSVSCSLPLSFIFGGIFSSSSSSLHLLCRIVFGWRIILLFSVREKTFKNRSAAQFRFVDLLFAFPGDFLPRQKFINPHDSIAPTTPKVSLRTSSKKKSSHEKEIKRKLK